MEEPLIHQIPQPTLDHVRRAPVVGGNQHHGHGDWGWLDEEGDWEGSRLCLNLALSHSLGTAFFLRAGKWKGEERRWQRKAEEGATEQTP